MFMLLNIKGVQYTAGSIRCGKPPVIVTEGTTFAGGSGTSYYYIEDDGSYYKPAETTFYYCTIDEAVDNYVEPGFKGYSEYSALDPMCPLIKERMAAYDVSKSENTILYYKKTDKELPEPTDGRIDYFCTEQQAINNGYGKMNHKN